MKEWRRTWNILREHADTNADGVISREEVHQAIAGAHGGRAGLQERLTPGLVAEFAAMDSDDDGIITVGQFESFLSPSAWTPRRPAPPARSSTPTETAASPGRVPERLDRLPPRRSLPGPARRPAGNNGLTLPRALGSSCPAPAGGTGRVGRSGRPALGPARRFRPRQR
ncbi:hypothetical protein GCM10010282_69220 [Streptomyces roseolus]|nr:hypothetical protein GCM10010282_69220 [Streptomyces roseolus]